MSFGQALTRVVDALGDDQRLDAAADPVADRVRAALGGQPLKDALSGVWLGHPLHPLLTDVTIGFWTSAFTLDFIGGRRTRRASTQLVAWGVVSALPTAITGAADWGDTTGPARRIGFVHAAANVAAVACYTASWWSRVRGRHWRGVALGVIGGTAATVGGYLGGHLLQELGVGTDQTSYVQPPQEWTRVARVAEITEAPQRFLAGEAPVIVLRHRDEVVALDARCPHRGAPLETGEVRDGCVVCPWHGSIFRLPDGALVQGPSTVDLPHYACRVVGDGVEVSAG